MPKQIRVAEPTSFDYSLNAQGAADRAQEFMGGDIVRGIVELLTNSDTAYGHELLDRKGTPIEVRVCGGRQGRWFEVRDRAGGMSPAILKEKFTEGGATSEAGQRGFFGVGAKDCAIFGKLTMETVDSDGQLSRVEIPREFRGGQLYPPRRAAKDDFERLFGRARGAGTVARVDAADPGQGGPSFPRVDTLTAKLRGHYALRGLLQRREVRLTEYRSGGKKGKSRLLEYPRAPWEAEEREQLYDGPIEVKAAGADSPPTLRLYKLPEEVPGSYADEEFEGFVLVRSEVADYGITLAGLEHAPHARRLVGELADQNIPTLLDAYREGGATGDNPRPVIKQSRDHKGGGLEPSHPYTGALMKGLKPIVMEALETLAAESRASERAGASEALDNANREAGRWLGAFLNEDGEDPKELPLGLYFLPPRKAVKPGKEGKLYLYCVGPDEPPALNVTWLSSDGAVCALSEDKGRLELENERNGNFIHRAKVGFCAGDVPGAAVVTARVGSDEALCSIEVREGPIDPVTDFGFENKTYSAQPSRRKKVRVLLPFDLLGDDPSTPLQLFSDDESVVVVGSSRVAQADCKIDAGRECYVATFTLEARVAGATATITAKYGLVEATARVSVSGSGMPVVLDDREADPPADRAVVNEQTCEEHPGARCLHVYVRHPRIQRYIGDVEELANGDVQWSLTDSLGFRAMCADAVAEAAAQHHLLAQVRPADEPLDPNELFRRFWEKKREALAQMHRVYIDSHSIPWDSQTTDPAS